jgi:tetratricopeptide (TPR) repeat protein
VTDDRLQNGTRLICFPTSQKSVRGAGILLVLLFSMTAVGSLHCGSDGEVAESLGQGAGETMVDSLAIYVRRGRTHMREQAYSQAIEQLSRAVRVNPESHEAQDMLGLAYAFKLEPGKAIEHIGKAIAIEPDDGNYQMHLGKAYMLLTDYAGATAAYERAIELGLAKGKPYYDLGIIAERESRLDAARSYYEKAIEVVPRFAPSCNLRLGIIAEKEGDDAKAIELYSKALKGDPSVMTAHYRIAQQYLRGGRQDLAERHLEQFNRLKGR